MPMPLSDIKDVMLIVGLPIAVYSAAMVLLQYRRTVTWNKLNATFALFPNKTYVEATTAVATSLERLNIDFHNQKDALTSTEVTKILADKEAYGSVKTLLNYLEDYATAIHTGLIHRRTSFQVMGVALTRYFTVFWPLVQARRADMGVRIWVELELANIVFTRLMGLKHLDERRLRELHEVTAREYYKDTGREDTIDMILAEREPSILDLLPPSMSRLISKWTSDLRGRWM